MSKKGGIFVMTFFHDDNCRTLFSRNMADCKCKVETKVGEMKTFEELQKSVKEDLKQWKETRRRYN